LISHGPIEHEVADAGFTIEGLHTQYVHRSLTREIVVARK
jgi:tRNA G10  N-methylase Trm11